MPITIFQAPAAQTRSGARAAAGRSDLRALAIRWLQELERWIERSRQRVALRELAADDEHLLADIGKSKAEAMREAAKPFWKP